MKTLLPLLGELDWSDLAVRDGREAGERYLRLCLTGPGSDGYAPPETEAAQLAELRRYCRRDTAGMLALYRALHAAARSED